MASDTAEIGWTSDILPDNYNYKILGSNVGESESGDLKFNIEVRVNAATETEVKTFLSDFNTSAGCTFNSKSGRTDKRGKGEHPRSVFSGYRKCCMNVAHCEDRGNQQPGKNTNCPAFINFRLENPIAKSKSDKEDKIKFPLWIKISYHHNHSLSRSEYFRFLSVSQETKDIYTEMFNHGMSPSSAHTERRKCIKSEFPDSWPEVFADRSRLPSLFWVYDMHRQWLDTVVGSRDGVDSYQRAEEMVQDFDKECKIEYPLSDGEYYAKIAQSDTGETVIAVCDPFMRRVHGTIPQCGNIVLIDATSNLDRNDSKLFHLVCPSPIGALPLAEIITTREDTETVMFGLETLKSVLPPDAFYGRGRDLGPHVFMTDDSDSERNALAAVWPQSVLLLCVFHVLQALWSWLWDGKHGIEHSDRPILLIAFRKVLYAETESELSEKLEELYANATALKYPQFQKHMTRDTLPKLKAWSIARRNVEKLPTNNHNTNNLVESSFRYAKEIQFNRLKAFNLPDMLSLILDKSEFYSNKCVDAGNNRIESWLKNCHSRYVIKRSNIDADKIVQLGPDTYLVPSETQSDVSYVVDMVLRCCSCPQGCLCGPCKHKNIVCQSKNLPSFDVIPTQNPVMKQHFMYLGTGKKMAVDWFMPLQAQVSGTEGDAEPQEQATGVHAHVHPCLNPVADVGAHLQTQSEVNQQSVKEKLEVVFLKFQNKILSRVTQDPVGYGKALNIFEKTVDRLPATVDSALQKSLCSFGKSVTQVGLVICLYS